ncbi:MAG: inositol monophosphatase family protein, partial [Pseudomonadota bacterium]
MTQFTLTDDLVQQVVNITQEAGKRIMEIYQQDFDISEKSDSSPLTEADLAAHNHIVDSLSKVSDLPILSEESAGVEWEERKAWVRYWLVDPLDGTKEFIKKNGEFTVNIALIEYGEPIFGVVDAPALEKTYVGVAGKGASILQDNGETPIQAKAAAPNETVKVVGSRSHQSPEIQKILSAIDAEHELIAMGSSLKLCCVADGN